VLEIVERRAKVAVGLNALARELGCSRGHLSLVIHGHRQSNRLVERLRKMGINIANEASINAAKENTEAGA